MSRYLYAESHPEFIIPMSDMGRFVFFYQNYTGLPYYWIYDHVWSLCVEVHFYILLPIVFIIIKSVIFSEKRRLFLYKGLILAILSVVIFKIISYYFTAGRDTYSATHNRVDAFAWGVLLNLLIYDYRERIQVFTKSLLLFFLGSLLLSISLFIFYTFDFDIMKKCFSIL